MEFTALRILLWGDDDDDSDVEFLEDLYACWSKLRSQRYMAPREHGSAGHHSACATHVLNNLICTDFQIQDSRHVLEWDVHRSGDLFIFARIYRKQQQSFIRMVEFMPPHHVRYISRLRRHYISSVPEEVVSKEHIGIVL